MRTVLKNSDSGGIPVLFLTSIEWFNVPPFNLNEGMYFPYNKQYLCILKVLRLSGGNIDADFLFCFFSHNLLNIHGDD